MVLTIAKYKINQLSRVVNEEVILRMRTEGLKDEKNRIIIIINVQFRIK
jgi:hypothetical protein